MSGKENYNIKSILNKYFYLTSDDDSNLRKWFDNDWTYYDYGVFRVGGDNENVTTRLMVFTNDCYKLPDSADYKYHYYLEILYSDNCHSKQLQEITTNVTGLSIRYDDDFIFVEGDGDSKDLVVTLPEYKKVSKTYLQSKVEVKNII